MPKARGKAARDPFSGRPISLQRVGASALRHNTTVGLDAGIGNTAVGKDALLSNSTGFFNAAVGKAALFSNTTGADNTALGHSALSNNTMGFRNTAIGESTLSTNIIGAYNTAIGWNAGVALVDLTNATAIGANAIVDQPNKIRLGDFFVTVIEGQVGFTSSSDATKKENFRPVDGEEVLRKIRGFNLTSWNFIGHDPKQFRHYGPTAQDFFAAFGQDEIGTIGTPTTINSGDIAGILMIAVQALEKRTAEIKQLKAESAELKARLERLERLVPARDAMAHK